MTKVGDLAFIIDGVIYPLAEQTIAFAKEASEISGLPLYRYDGNGYVGVSVKDRRTA